MGVDEQTGSGFVSSTDISKAKAFLQSVNNGSGIELYEHLKNVLTKLLNERPRDPAVLLEDVSREVKQNKSEDETYSDKVDRTTEVALAEVQVELFRRKGDSEFGGEESVDSVLPDLMRLQYFFEQAGVGLNREEMVRLQLAMKKLIDTFPLQHARFWGKIFGTEQNYYVIEVEFRDGEEPEEIAEEELAEQEIAPEEEEEDGEEESENLPEITWKPPPAVPKEEKGSGCNKFTYFVCNEPGKAWLKLPAVTPQQIQVSRKIRKFFTGNLNATVSSFPPFPGNEANLLRAQIARIGAATSVSPLGFYQFDENDEEEAAEEGIVRETFIANDEFAGLSVQELSDVSLNNWVHHSMHILPQGRCSWWNPASLDAEEEAEEEEEEEEGGLAKVKPEPEVGPPLLSPLSADHSVDGIPAWTVRVSSRHIPPHCALAVLSSNLWPGAHSFCQKKTFENVYIGWGQKYSVQDYTPSAAPEIMNEYPIGPDVCEITDPTPEDEAALQDALLRADAAADEAAEEEQPEDDD